jgi:hypothetical protein
MHVQTCLGPWGCMWEIKRHATHLDTTGNDFNRNDVMSRMSVKLQGSNLIWHPPTNLSRPKQADLEVAISQKS